MNDDTEYDNAMNCANAYWQHPAEDGNTDQLPRQMTRRTERVICRLMTQAIYFANAWSSEVKDNIREDSVHNREIKGLIRCTIVDVYKDILTEAGCEGHWGTYYAWYVVDQMWEAMKDTWRDQHCNNGKYKTIELKTWNTRNKMKEWLKQDARVKKKLEQEQISDGCTGRKVQTREQLQKEGEIKDNADENKKDEELKTRMKADIMKHLGVVQQELEHEEEKLRASGAPAPTYDSVGAEDTKDAEIAKHMKGKIADVQEKLKPVIAKNAAAQEAAAKAANTPSKASPGGKKPAVSPPKVPEAPTDPVPEDKIPVPTPPSDAQAPAVGTGGRSDTPPADASAGTQKGKDAETAGKCTREPKVFTHSNTRFGLNGASATITLSIACSSENADDCDTTPQDSGPGSVLSEY
ncbi:hypothetical protein AK88_05631 [Plasmodium fragile]|uniref:Schizont-infected cell agglutination extracellular alpha domain-containing protein n=1 Tax=Plasmodium fragile TaxID=5857 RepID=A0A0D9QGA7_PLAFR|nr:uncharacterized protein AK88_05631 [Plasmodium fragile]KJP84736.1 hypothetical protein AK88_05631 [Plasmodium fragile]